MKSGKKRNFAVSVPYCALCLLLNLNILYINTVFENSWFFANFLANLKKKNHFGDQIKIETFKFKRRVNVPTWFVQNFAWIVSWLEETKMETVMVRRYFRKWKDITSQNDIKTCINSSLCEFKIQWNGGRNFLEINYIWTTWMLHLFKQKIFFISKKVYQLKEKFKMKISQEIRTISKSQRRFSYVPRYQVSKFSNDRICKGSNTRRVWYIKRLENPAFTNLQPLE